MEKRMINACPSCGSGQLTTRRGAPRYICRKCGETFQIPNTKEVKIDINKIKLPPALLKFALKN